jgi:hypothetical protein
MDDNPDYFTGKSALGSGKSSQFNSLSAAVDGDSRASGDNFSVEWKGFFYAAVDGSYSFSTESDDCSFFWIGSRAKTGYTLSNALVNNGGVHTSQLQSGSISLNAGQYYDIRIQYGQLNSSSSFKMSINPPNGGATYDGKGFLFEADAGRRRRLLKAPAVAPTPAVAPAQAPAPAPTDEAASLVPSANVYIVASKGGPQGDVQPINGTTSGDNAPAGAPEPALSGAEALKANIGADLEALKNQFQAVVMPIKSNDPTTEGLFNALMLSGIVIGAVVLLHILLRAAAIWRKIRMPEILLWPAPELMIVGAFIPLIVAAAARKFFFSLFHCT